MNVVIILEATLGGTRKHVVDLIMELKRQGYVITFLYADQRADSCFETDLEHLKKTGIHCIHIPMTKNLFHPTNVYSLMKMARILWRTKPTIVHLHGAVAGALGRMAVMGNSQIRRVIYSPHGGVLHKINKSFVGRIFILIEKLLNSRRVFYVAVSSDEREKLKNYFQLAASKVRLIHNGIDADVLQKEKYSIQQIQKFRAELQLSSNDLVLLYPALFLEAKGHLQFFHAFKKHQLMLNSKVKILLAGDGPLQPAVQELVNYFPFREQIKFLGFVNDIPKYFQLADAVLLPSVNEAFGYVLLEAMVFAKPIFATSVGGIKDIVENQRNGFLYDPDALHLMIRDINRFAEEKNQLKSLGYNSENLVRQKFSKTITMAKLEEFYNEAVI
ncbi:MAG TPA: glycosyltransferase [Flavisolibacter sp.]|jgi:glycosyltransferase involved in cell wall biosynthesis|nr:glycosyltransferase [Flavisolibacter sp.]